MRFKKKEGIKKVTAVLLLLFMMFSICLENCKPVFADTDNDNGIVTVAVERFTIGKGYVIEPTFISIKEGEDYASLIKRFLDSKGYKYTMEDTQYGSYLAAIHDADPSDMKLNIPNSILKMARDKGDYTLNNELTNAYSPKLSEFSYTRTSGWMFSINNVFPNVGLGNAYPKNGDVCRLQFTIFGTGADVSGKDIGSGKVYYTPANRTKLLRKIAEINQAKKVWFTIDGCEEAYNKAMTVLNNFDATQTEVDLALKALPSMDAVYPTSIVLAESNLSIDIDNKDKLLTATVYPKNSTFTKVIWSSSDHKVITVDETGKLMPVSVGEADITVTTINGCSATCHATVKDRPITEILLNKSSISCERDESFQLSVEKWMPENTTDEKIVTWSSTNSEVAQVSESGYVTAKKSGEADIKGETKTGISAICHITVGNSKELAKAMEEKISELPEPSDMKEEHIKIVYALRDEYDSLKETSKTYISDKEKEKLKSCVERADVLSVVLKIKELPSLSKLTLEDEARVKEIRENYEALSDKNQKLVGRLYLKRLSKAETRLKDLIKEAKDVEDRMNNLPEEVSLEDIKLVIEIRNQYEGELTKAQKDIISDEAKAKLTHALGILESSIENAVAGVDTSKDIDVNSKEIQTFLKAMDFYEDMYGIMEVSTKTREKIESLKGWIGESIHSCENINVESPWYIKTKVSKLTGKSSILKQIKKNYDSSNSSIVFAKEIKYEDIRNKSDYSQEKAVAIEVKLQSDYKALKNPKIFMVKDGKIKELDATYNEDSNTIKVYSRNIGKLIVAEVPIEIKDTDIAPTVQVEKRIKDALNETKNYMVSIDKNPAKGSEWFVIGLARSGKDINSDYFDTYYNHMVNYLKENEGKLTNTIKYTEYSKVIVTMTAIGKDARDVGGYNLFSNLADLDEVKKQGINGPTWALIALKSNPEYVIPEIFGVKEQTTEESLINYILSQQKDDGGWNLSEGAGSSDVDLTAMALQALAPYYNKEGRKDVTSTIDKALTFLSKKQLKTGGFGYGDVETSESNAQVITALCSLGIDPEEDSRFIKNGYWPVENLLQYHIPGSGFIHVKSGASNNGGAEGGKVDGMATEQAFYALVAYDRLKNGKTPLYDMTDLSIKPGGNGDESGTGINNGSTGQMEPSKDIVKEGDNSPDNLSDGGKKKTVSKTSKTSSKSKKTEKKDTDKKTKDESKESEEGWEFTGEEYEGTTDSPNTNLEGKAALEDNDNLIKEYLPYGLCILCGVAVIGVCIYYKKKK